MKEISKRIKRYRLKAGLTQQAVASELGIQTSNYAKYESGERNPKEDKLIALSKMFNVPYDSIVTGVEREFLDLLHTHAMGAVLGDVEGFDSFLSDIELSEEVYEVILSFFSKGGKFLKEQDEDYYRKHIENPTLQDLITLYDSYIMCRDKVAEHLSTHGQLGTDSSEIVEEELLIAKWAFCVAVDTYMNGEQSMEPSVKHGNHASDGSTYYGNTEAILAEAGKMAGNINALQFFAVKVFVPYLKLIIDAVELCMNTSIDDFGTAFLHGQLSGIYWDDGTWEPADLEEFLVRVANGDFDD